MSGAQIHTFTIPQTYHNEHTANSLRDLAEAINEAWRDAVRADYNEEEPK